MSSLLCVSSAKLNSCGLRAAFESTQWNVKSHFLFLFPPCHWDSMMGQDGILTAGFSLLGQQFREEERYRKKNWQPYLGLTNSSYVFHTCSPSALISHSPFVYVKRQRHTTQFTHNNRDAGRINICDSPICDLLWPWLSGSGSTQVFATRPAPFILDQRWETCGSLVIVGLQLSSSQGCW